jgi:ABC-2 type transport system ATP-binding protein
MAMLQIRRLEKIFEQRSVLSIEELDGVAGDILAVVGPSQSGKSLLLRMLTGTLLPSGGTVTLAGQDIHRSPQARAQIGAVFEEDLLYERLSVQDNLDLYRQFYGLPRSRVIETLARIGLSDQARQPIARLSSSAQRRLAFARLLVWHPTVYLLDQPVTRCDLPTQELFAHVILQLAQEGALVIMADEDLAWMGRLCTRLVELQDGRIISSRASAQTAPSAPDQEQGNDPHTAVAGPDRLTPFRIPARKEDRILLFDPGEILYATSREGKIMIRTVTDEATSNLTLQELEQQLLGRGFFKSHRAYLVNLEHIKAIIQYTRDSYTLQLNDIHSTMVPLSKQYEKELKDLLGY